MKKRSPSTGPVSTSTDFKLEARRQKEKIEEEEKKKAAAAEAYKNWLQRKRKEVKFFY